MSWDVGYPSPDGDAGALPAGTASRRYSGLQYDREPFLIRARRQSRLTIPTLFRELGENSTTTETLPWQSLTGSGVENFNQKLVNTMFPSAIPWQKLDPAPAAVAAATAQYQDPAQFAAWDDAVRTGLSKVQQDFLKCVAQDGDRKRLLDCGRHLIVGGTHGLKLDRKKAKLQSIRLERFVNIRDNSGDLLEFVVEDGMSYQSLPDDIRAMVSMRGQDPKQAHAEKSINVYTHGCLSHGAWELYQEVCGEEVSGTRERLDEDVMPYMFPRMIALEKENYGRSYCEFLEADMQTLDGYYQFLTEGGANLAQLKWLVKPGGMTNKKAFAEAANGAVLTGDPEDVTAVKADKGGDFAQAYQILDRVEKRLERAFIMVQGATRDAERVTAEEIQLMTQQLDATASGAYANLTDDFQAPYGSKKLGILQRTKRLPALPKGLVTLSIRSGEEALADAQEVQALDRVLTNAAAALNPQSAATQYIKPRGYLARQFAKEGIDPTGILKTEDEVKAEQQAAQQQAALQSATPNIVKGVSDLAQQHVQNQADAAQAAPQPEPQGA